MSFNKPERNSNKTLFLDRDGVINQKVEGAYVLGEDQFKFLPGVIEAIPILNKYFRNIFVVTNQQCIAKGLLDMTELAAIHNFMLEKIEAGGGIIRDIFVSPHHESEESEFRKPNIGLARLAAKKYPEVDLSESMMAGDSKTDMIFGRSAGMTNILIESGESIARTLYDLKTSSLIDFALLLENG